nr:hypothetical protein [uncultured Acidovorax sp.]
MSRFNNESVSSDQFATQTVKFNDRRALQRHKSFLTGYSMG